MYVENEKSKFLSIILARSHWAVSSAAEEIHTSNKKNTKIFAFFQFSKNIDQCRMILKTKTNSE